MIEEEWDAWEEEEFWEEVWEEEDEPIPY